MAQFLGIPDSESTIEKAKIVILPIPYEATTSYGKGTKNGPRAILEASSYVEFFDEELEMEPYTLGLHTLEEIRFGDTHGADAIELIYSNTKKIVDAGKLPFGLGGEHSISTGLVKAVHEKYPDLHVVHLDAHSDMREEYEGTKWSHASVIRRIHEMGIPYTSIGIRSISREEFDFTRPLRKNYFFAHDIANSDNWIQKALDTISGPVFLTFDVDVFDGSIISATGTPEPGGLNWYQITTFLKKLFEKKKVVGADVVELAPIEDVHVSDFAIAKLVYKIIGYWGKTP